MLFFTMKILVILHHRISVAEVGCYYSVVLCCFPVQLFLQDYSGKTSTQVNKKKTKLHEQKKRKKLNPQTKVYRQYRKTLHSPYSLLYTHLIFIAVSWCICSNLPQTLMCKNKKMALVLILYSLFSLTRQDLTSIDLSILCSKEFDIKADCFHTNLSNIICFTSEYALAS